MDGVAKLKEVVDAATFDNFETKFFNAIKLDYRIRFDDALKTLGFTNMRAFRVRYALAKITRDFDLRAYGATAALSDYMRNQTDIEHILPNRPSASAAAEFGANNADPEICQRLGNLLIIERSLNRLLSNKAYSEKIKVYAESKFLLTKCQSSKPELGKADQITKVAERIKSFADWNLDSLMQRQEFLASTARDVWHMPAAVHAVL